MPKVTQSVAELGLALVQWGSEVSALTYHALVSLFVYSVLSPPFFSYSLVGTFQC